MPSFFSGRGSGFKNPRDFLLFFAGFGLIVFHVCTVPPDHYNMPFLLFGAGLMGAQYVVGKDNSEKDDKKGGQ